MATEKQIPKLAGIVTEHQSGLTALSTEDADWAIKNGHVAVALFVSAVKNRAKAVATNLLQYLTVDCSMSLEQMIAAGHYDTQKSRGSIQSWH